MLKQNDLEKIEHYGSCLADDNVKLTMGIQGNTLMCQRRIKNR